MPYKGTREQRIKEGKCAICGKRKTKEGKKGCEHCLKYAREYRSKHETKPCRVCGVKTRKGRCIRCAAFQPSFVRKMSPVEAAWVGALIEGEGTIQPGKSISCGSTEVETISTLIRFVGGGRVYLAKQKEKTYKPFWLWVVAVHASVVDLSSQITPFLTSKQVLAEQAAKTIK